MNYLKSFTAYALILCLLFLFACNSTPRVRSGFDAQHNFVNDKAFTWLHNPPLLKVDSYFISKQAQLAMTDAIKQEMQSKGFKFADQDRDADFAIMYTINVEEKVELVRYPSHYQQRDVYGRWGGYYFPYYYVDFPYKRGWQYGAEFERYFEGDIVVNIFDTGNKQLIWKTKASKPLSKKELRDMAKNAQQIAKDLLRHFPEIGCEVGVTAECRPFH